MANANAMRDWRVYADLAQSLIGIAHHLYAEEPFGVDLKETVYALDASTIDLCLSVFPWAPFRSTKAAVKLHTLLDLHGNIPTFLHISDGKLHDVNILDLLFPEPGASANAAGSHQWRVGHLGAAVYLVTQVRFFGNAWPACGAGRLLSLTVFERLPLNQLLTKSNDDDNCRVRPTN